MVVVLLELVMVSAVLGQMMLVMVLMMMVLLMLVLLLVVQIVMLLMLQMLVMRMRMRARLLVLLLLANDTVLQVLQTVQRTQHHGGARRRRWLHGMLLLVCLRLWPVWRGHCVWLLVRMVIGGARRRRTIVVAARRRLRAGDDIYVDVHFQRVGHGELMMKWRDIP